MLFEEAKEYVDNLSRFGSVLGLENIKELLRRLGNPQDSLKCIHVAGTNGKGSTIAFIAKILSKAGYSVGRYTSPVVFEYLEKYRINDDNITESDFSVIVQKVKEAAVSMALDTDGKAQPTQFEVETAMAFVYFAMKKCDIVILETGMGGDLDATNVCDSVLASVIVSISLDHTAFLGDTLTEIATHKAGIIKKDCPVVLYKQSRDVMDTVCNVASGLNAKVIIAGEDPRIIESTKAVLGEPKKNIEVFSYESVSGKLYENIETGLCGSWQIRNATVAIETIELLKGLGYNIRDNHIYEGLKDTNWNGRFETICFTPHIIIDGAHNPGAAIRLRETLDKKYCDTRFIYIMGVLADKDFTEVIRLMADKADKIITVTPNNYRALSGEKLAKAVSAFNPNVCVADSINEAIDMAVQEYDNMKEPKAILAFGSLSYLGDFKKIVEEKYICI